MALICLLVVLASTLFHCGCAYRNCRNCVEFTLTAYDSQYCTTSNMQLSESVRLEYRKRMGPWTPMNVTIKVTEDGYPPCNETDLSTLMVNNMKINITSVYIRTLCGLFPAAFDLEGDGEGIQLRFVQLDHRGGYCDCWSVSCDVLLRNSGGIVVNSIQTSCEEDSSGRRNNRQELLNEVGSGNISSGQQSDENSSGSSFKIQMDEEYVSGSGSSNSGQVSNEEGSGGYFNTQTDLFGGSDSLQPLLSGSGSGYSGQSSVDKGSGGSANAQTEEDDLESSYGMITQCGGSASVERVFVIEFGQSLHCERETDMSLLKAEENTGIQVNDCDEENYYAEVNFTYNFINLDNFDEGLELAFYNQNGKKEWIPIWFYSAHDPNVRTARDISLGNIINGHLTLRGYYVNISVEKNDSENEAHIQICGPDVFNKETADRLFKWRFRWQQTVALDGKNDTDGDIIHIDNVKINIVEDGRQNLMLFEDDFESQNGISRFRWPMASERNVDLVSDRGNGSYLRFNLFQSITDRADISSREISTVCLSGITKIQYTLITSSSQFCNSQNLTSPIQHPLLQYQRMNSKWMNLKTSNVNDSIIKGFHISRFQVDSNVSTLGWLGRCYDKNRFRFIQSEHRGGSCNCLEVSSLSVTLTSGQTRSLRKLCGDNITLGAVFGESELEMAALGESIAGFCGDSASVPRELVVQLENDSSIIDRNERAFCNVVSDKVSPQSECDLESELRIDVTFDLALQSSNSTCNQISDFREGMEFSFRTATEGEWVPLMFFAKNSVIPTHPFIQLPNEQSIGSVNRFKLRGYTVPYIIQSGENSKYNISICTKNANDKLQFRWLHTTLQDGYRFEDVIILDNVTVTAHNCKENVTLLEDDFDNEDCINTSIWNSALTYNVHLISNTETNSCRPHNGGALFFYLKKEDTIFTGYTDKNYSISSRQLATNFNDVALPSICMPTKPPPDSESNMTVTNESASTPSITDSTIPFMTESSTSSTTDSTIPSMTEVSTSNSNTPSMSESDKPSTTGSSTPSVTETKTIMFSTSESNMPSTTESIIPSTTESVPFAITSSPNESTTMPPSTNLNKPFMSESVTLVPSMSRSTTPFVTVSLITSTTGSSSSSVTMTIMFSKIESNIPSMTESIIPFTTESIPSTTASITSSTNAKVFYVPSPTATPSTTNFKIFMAESITPPMNRSSVPSATVSLTSTIAESISPSMTEFHTSSTTEPIMSSETESNTLPSTTELIMPLISESTIFSTTKSIVPSIVASVTSSLTEQRAADYTAPQSKTISITDSDTTTTDFNTFFTSDSIPFTSPLPSVTPDILTSRLLGLFESARVPGINFTATVLGLSSIFSEFIGIFDPKTIKFILSNVNPWFNITQNNFEKGHHTTEDYLAGSTLLLLLDNLTVHSHNMLDFSYENFDLQVNRVSVLANYTRDTPLNKLITLYDGDNVRISVPKEVFTGTEEFESATVSLYLFRNLSGFLPQTLQEDMNRTHQLVLRLASPVVSVSLLCANCTTSNLSIPAEITFKHLPYDKALLENDPNGSIRCVFWQFEESRVQNGVDLLFPGEWSQEGCETSFTSTMTVCKCNHLTHFAILLSARPLDLPQPKTLALQITGYIGVSISLVAMVATIFMFIYLKSLRTMRNYIHIQLCVSLGIAQVIFVAGIEPRLGEGQLVGGVPVGCRSVAVLLHYWFLVSFMWMLMEGVVLYVALVRVFVKYHRRYIVGFTVVSYGLPLLYIGALTVPLGFARTDGYRQNDTYDYGYVQACYLNPATSFVWSLLTPVILIFLANIGFFIMAIVIMYKHQKRQHTEDKVHKFKHWLKASISLTVVMGLTWIIGFLVIEVEELFALAYIFTIFVAFQGLFIFVIFVLLSKQVRENYAKWWKAKVSESDFLSKHFGVKTLTMSTELQQKKHFPSNDKAEQNQLTGTYKESEFVQDHCHSYTNESSLQTQETEGLANTFNVTYIPSYNTPESLQNLLSCNSASSDDHRLGLLNT